MYRALAPDCIGHSVTLRESAPIAEKYGFEGIWFNIERDSKMPVEETKELLSKYNLKASGFALPVEYRKDEETYRADMDKLEGYVKYAKECGIERCITWIVPASEVLSYEENFELHRVRLIEAAKILKNYGMTFGLEFLGPPKLRKGVKHEFIHNLDQMLALCNAIGTGNMGILMDLWHWDMADQVYTDFKKFPNEKWIVCAHIMDAPAGIPKDEQEDLIRALPGATGILRAEEFFKGLMELGYTGPVMPEPFVEGLKNMTFEEAVATVKEAIDIIWPKG